VKVQYLLRRYRYISVEQAFSLGHRPSHTAIRWPSLLL